MTYFDVKVLKIEEHLNFPLRYYWHVRGSNGIEHLQDGTAQELLDALRVQITTPQPEKGIPLNAPPMDEIKGLPDVTKE